MRIKTSGTVTGDKEKNWPIADRCASGGGAELKEFLGGDVPLGPWYP